MDTIGLIAAIKSESQALLDLVKGASRIQKCAYQAFRFEVGGHECILVTCGMGVKRAEAAARWMVDSYHPACVISFGIAGAVQPDLKIGDVVLATQNATLENGSLSPTAPLMEPSSEAWNGTVRALEKENIRAMKGCAITTRGAQFADCPPDWEHPILEMETSGLLRGLPDGMTLLVLRSISDGPNNPIPVDLGKAMDEDGNLRMGKMLGMVLKQPGILLKAGPMMRNSRAAADHAARAVLEVLQQGGLPAA